LASRTISLIDCQGGGKGRDLISGAFDFLRDQAKPVIQHDGIGYRWDNLEITY
jgi:hypothetical protein